MPASPEATPPGRIAIILTKMDEGGAINVALQLAEGLRGRGHEVELWFLYVARPTLMGAPGVHAMLSRSPGSPLDYGRMLAGLHAAFRRFKPHAAHGIMPLGNIAGLGMAALAGCRSRVASQHQPRPTLHPIMQALDKAAGTLGIYTANIAVSETVRRSFDGHPSAYDRRLTVVPNGVAERSSGLSKAAARSFFNLPLDAPLLGTVGRLVPEKNQAFLLEVLARLPTVHLAIGGTGELDQPLRRKAMELGVVDRLHLLGHIPGDRIGDVLRAFDLFLFPSLSEGMPIALLEAMTAGLPILASDIPANREVAAPSAASIVDTGSADRWAAEVTRLLDDRGARDALADAARERAKTFTKEAMIDGYERLLLAGIRR